MDTLWLRVFVLAQWLAGDVYDVLRSLRAAGIEIGQGESCLTLTPPDGMSRAAMVAMMGDEAGSVCALLISAHPANDRVDGELSATLPQCVIDQCKGLYRNERKNTR